MQDATKEVARPHSTALQRFAAFVQPPMARRNPGRGPATGEGAAMGEGDGGLARIGFNFGPWRVRLGVAFVVAGALGLAFWALLIVVAWLMF